MWRKQRLYVNQWSNRPDRKALALVAGTCGVLATAAPASAQATPYYQGFDEMVTFEAEGFQQNAPAGNGDAWTALQVDSDGTTDYATASNAAYIRSLPDDGDKDGFNGGSTSYDFRIAPADDGKDFRFYSRYADTTDSLGSGNTSDSAALRLFSVDHSGNETQVFEDDNVGVFRTDGEFNYYGANSGNTYTLNSGTRYRLRNYAREDGIAADQFIGTTGFKAAGSEPFEASPRLPGPPQPPDTEGLVSGNPGFGRQFIRNHRFSLRAAVYGTAINSHSDADTNFADLGVNGALAFEREVSRVADYAEEQNLDWAILPDDYPDPGRSADQIRAYERSFDRSIGYVVDDEPSRNEMVRAGNEADAWRDAVPNKPFYSVAYPSYASATTRFGQTPPAGGYSYEQYLNDFVSLTNSDYLSYNHYPFRENNRRRNTYFSDLMDVREAAQSADLPYEAYLQGFATGGYRVPSESDLRMQAFTHLAAGYKGFTYFFYNSLGNTSDGGLVRLDDHGDPVPTEIYNHAKSVNPEILNLGRPLRYLESEAVRFVPGQSVTSGTSAEHSAPQGLSDFEAGAGGDPHIESISVLDNGDAKDGLIGLLTDDRGQHAFMLSNIFHGGDLTPSEAELTFDIIFDGEVNQLLKISRQTGEQETVNVIGDTLSVTLPGGTGNLYKYANGDFVVPEPGTAAMLAIGGMSLLIRRRRRQPGPLKNPGTINQFS